LVRNIPAQLPVKLDAKKFPGIEKNIYKVSFDLSFGAASLKANEFEA
jgi:hypothetical protein